MSTPTAYPLQWPAGWPATEPFRRQPHPQFKQTVSSSLTALKKEIELIGGKNLVLSSNYTLGNEHPKEPGVVAYFFHDGTNFAIPCDRWSKIEHNIYAIAKTIEAIRGMERWGAKHMIKAMFQGFKALPAASPSTVDAWAILGLPVGASREQIESAYRSKAKAAHPDTAGGSHEAFIRLKNAYDQLIR